MNEEAQRSLERMAAQSAKKAEDSQRRIRHAEDVDTQLQTQEVIVRSFRSLLDYLDNRVSKTAVVNQLQEIGTPDAYKVVEAVNSLEQTLENKQTDLTEITDLLRSQVQELEKIPKSHNDIKIPEQVDNTKQLEALSKAIGEVEKAVKAQKLIAEAPVVNVDPQVNVEAPDLSEIKAEQEKTRKEMVKAVKAIAIPETNLEKLEKESLKQTKLLKEIRDKPVSSGGGGGGRATPYQDSNDIPAFVELEADGSVPVTIANPEDISGSTVYSKPTDAYELVQYDDSTSSSYEYYLYSDKDANYYVKRVDTTYNYTEFKSSVTPTTGSGFYAWVSALTSWQTYGAAF